MLQTIFILQYSRADDFFKTFCTISKQFWICQSFFENLLCATTCYMKQRTQKSGKIWSWLLSVIVQLDREDKHNQLKQCRTGMGSGRRTATASEAATASWWPWANYLSSLGLPFPFCKMSYFNQRWSKSKILWFSKWSKKKKSLKAGVVSKGSPRWARLEVVLKNEEDGTVWRESGEGTAHSGQQELEGISSDSGVMNVILAGARGRAGQWPREIQLSSKCGARPKAEPLALTWLVRRRLHPLIAFFISV